MSLPKIVAHFETQLVNKIDSASVSLELASITTPAGNLPAGTYGFVIDEESSAKREYVIGTLSGSTLTLTKRDVSPLDATTVDASADTARQSHRKGASIKITNFPILLLLQRLLDGTDQFDASAPFEYDGTASITTANQLATKAYVDSVVNGGTLILQDQVLLGDAGETVSAGEYVYLKEADGEWYKVDADNSAHLEGTRKGIAQGSGTDGTAIAGGILVEGLDTTIAYTTGQVYYASNTAGALATSAGTNSYKVGVGDANGKLVLYLNPLELSVAEKDAIAGGGDFGTPSSTNKFLTEEKLHTEDVSVIVYDVADSPATWTKKTGLKKILVQMWGGGGSGACVNETFNGTESYGGGGGGAYKEKWFTPDELGATETVTIGAGGSAVSRSTVGYTAGNNGAQSSFGSLLVALGGSLGTNRSGGNGGAVGWDYGVGGDTTQTASANSIFGGAGGGRASSSGAYTNSGNSIFGGAGGGTAVDTGTSTISGGSSVYGGNGGNGVSNSSGAVTGGSGVTPAGGGGSAVASTGQVATSGAGGGGRVIVTEFYA